MVRVNRPTIRPNVSRIPIAFLLLLRRIVMEFTERLQIVVDEAEDWLNLDRDDVIDDASRLAIPKLQTPFAQWVLRELQIPQGFPCAVIAALVG